MQTYDIAIIGGGIVGLTMAYALSRRTTLTIVVLESKNPSPPFNSEQYHPRVSAITLKSKRFFQSLDIWDDIKNIRVSPFKAIQVWDGKTTLNFNSQEIAEPELGYIVENDLITSVLYQRLKTAVNVKVVAPVNLQDIHIGKDHIEINAADGTSYKAKVSIAADGANSWLRKEVNIAVERYDYHQSAIVCTVQTELPHQQIARQDFLPSGPIAFLPLQDPYTSSIVWSQSGTSKKDLDDDAFKEILFHNFKYLGEIKHCDKRYLFPLYKQQAKSYLADKVVLIGDAAHTVHPLAGLGVNMGLLDVSCLLDVITQAIAKKRNYASFATLRKYERARKAENYGLMTAIDMLKSIFAIQNPILKSLRTCGVVTTNNIPFLKRFFIKYASGR